MAFKYLKNQPNWLGQRMVSIDDDTIRKLFIDIANFRRTGILSKDSYLHTLDKEFSAEIHNKDNHLRIIEDEVLFEMGRRFYNLGAEKEKDAISPTIQKQIDAYLADPNTEVYLKYNCELGQDQWLYAVVVAGSDDFWLDAFEQEKEALDYIEAHHLKRID